MLCQLNRKNMIIPYYLVLIPHTRDCFVSLLMLSPKVHIDFKKMQAAIKAYVRRKAEISGSDIFYIRDGELIQEHPKTNKKTVLKVVVPK